MTKEEREFHSCKINGQTVRLDTSFGGTRDETNILRSAPCPMPAHHSPRPPTDHNNVSSPPMLCRGVVRRNHRPPTILGRNIMYCFPIAHSFLFTAVNNNFFIKKKNNNDDDEWVERKSATGCTQNNPRGCCITVGIVHTPSGGV